MFKQRNFQKCYAGTKSIIRLFWNKSLYKVWNSNLFNKLINGEAFLILFWVMKLLIDVKNIFKNIMPGQNDRFMLGPIWQNWQNFLLGGMAFSEIKLFFKNQFYRKFYVGTFMLVFTENHIQFRIRASIFFSIFLIWSIGKNIIFQWFQEWNKNVLDFFHLCPGKPKLGQYSLYHWNSKILKQLAACQGIFSCDEQLKKWRCH